MPVVQTCAFELGIVNLEAHRTDQMQPCTRCGAGAGNIARILRNLRLNKNNIQPCQKNSLLMPIFRGLCIFCAFRQIIKAGSQPES